MSDYFLKQIFGKSVLEKLFWEKYFIPSKNIKYKKKFLFVPSCIEVIL